MPISQENKEKQILAVWPDTKTPEQLEAYEKYEENFNTQYKDTFWALEDKYPWIVGKIRWNYCLNGGKIEAAIQGALLQSGASSEQVQMALGVFSNKNTEDEEKETEKKSSFDTLSSAEKLPEFEYLQRLSDEWYISPENFTKFKEWAQWQDKKVIEANAKKLLWSIPDEKVRSTMGKRIFWNEVATNPQDDTEGVNTPEEFKKSDFYRDFWSIGAEKAPEFSDFNTMLANNYITIPSKNSETSNKKADLEASFETSAKKIIIQQNGDFKSRNSDHINQLFSKNSSIQEKYLALKTLFDESQLDSAKRKQARSTWIEWEKNKKNTEKLAKVFEAIQNQNQANLMAQANQKALLAQLEAAEKWSESKTPQKGNIEALSGGKMDVASSSKESSKPSL